jgi:hypothetical protein
MRFHALLLLGALSAIGYRAAFANPHLPKAGEAPIKIRIGTCDGFNVIYNLSDLGLPFIYSSLFTNIKAWKERPFSREKRFLRNNDAARESLFSPRVRLALNRH